MPFWPVNQSMPPLSKVAVLRFAFSKPFGSGNSFTSWLFGSTRAIAFSPLSVIQAAPSGPAITPCGDAPLPSGTCSTLPVFGSRMPSAP